MLDEREAVERERAAMRFHIDALAGAIAERESLDGVGGWLARLWRTRDADIAATEARIATHRAALADHRARLADAEAQLARAEASEAAERAAEQQRHLDLRSIEDAARDPEHPSHARLSAIDASLAQLEASHSAEAAISRTGAALVHALRASPSPSQAGFLTSTVARALKGNEDIKAFIHAFSAACREGDTYFSPSGDAESLVIQVETILAPLRERSIELTRERKSLEAERAQVLQSLLETSLADATPRVVSTEEPE